MTAILNYASAIIMAGLAMMLGAGWIVVVWCLLFDPDRPADHKED